jgi:plastocyanin
MVVACGASEIDPQAGVKPTANVVPNACSLLPSSTVATALGEKPLPPAYVVTSVTSHSTVGQCTYTGPSGASIVVSVFPKTTLTSLAGYLSGATSVGPARLLETSTAGLIAVEAGSATVEIALDAAIPQDQRSQRLGQLAAAVLGSAASLPEITAAPSAAASASSTAGATAGAPGTKVSGATAAQTVQETDSLKFQPESTTLKAGDVVQWVNGSAVAHNVTFNDYPDITSDTQNSGDKYEVKFTQPGTYHYVCTFHPPGMVGTITVS